MSPYLSRMFGKTSRAMDEGQSAGCAWFCLLQLLGRAACMRVQHGFTPVRESRPHVSTAAADSSTLGAAVRLEPPSTGTGLQDDSVILSPVKIRDVYPRGLRDEFINVTL